MEVPITVDSPDVLLLLVVVTGGSNEEGGCKEGSVARDVAVAG